MKVTVCFGSTRVIVPCGEGELPVRDLIEKAIVRYKKATGKPNDYWVTVHNVKTSEDGGILDPDDQLSDVADDREQIIAYFEEQGGPPIPHNGGDGASASSVGTSSPDIFQGGELTVIHSDRNDVVVTPGDLSSGSALKVRRGSEPALNNLGQDENKITDHSNTGTFPKKAKRWSAIITPIDGIHVTSTPKRDSDSSEDESSRKIPLRVGANGQEKNLFNRFARDSWRQSLSNQPSMFKWLEAQERQEDKFTQGQTERKEPVGMVGGSAATTAASGSVTTKNSQKESDNDSEKAISEASYSSVEEDNSVYLILRNDGGPLGIHVVPDFDENGRDMGLKVQSIEKGGRIFKDGRLKVEDRIIEINGTSLVDVNFARAQSVFKQAMQTDDIQLRVLKLEAPPLPKQPPPVLPKTKPKPNRNHNLPTRPSPLTLPNVIQSEVSSLKSTDSYSDTDSTQRTSSSVETINEKTPTNSGTDSTVSNSDSNSRTKNTLSNGPVKGNSGKGSISVSFNVNGKVSQPTKSSMPIKPGPPIKAGGASVALNKAGGTAATVNKSGGAIIVNKSGSAINGNKAGSAITVNGTSNDSRKVPPQPPARHPSTSLSATSSMSSERGITAPTNTRRIGKKINIQLTKGPVGLGFSITTRDNPAGGNCPIYIKNILPKGAAIMDGRLKAGDRLLEVNGIEMTGKTQSEAVNILRNTKMGSTVHLVVSRQVDDAEDMFKVPRKLSADITDVLQPTEKAQDDDGTLAFRKNKEILELNIPLNDTGSAGLGVSVKGKTQTTENGVQDLGIFIKAVIHGGAASKDGRLAINDQLLEVNSESLVGLSNADAMETLRKAMQEEGLTPGCINIQIARRIGAPSPSPFGEEEHELKIRTMSEASETSNISRFEMEGGDRVSESSDVSFNDSHDQTVRPGSSILDHLGGMNQSAYNSNKLHNPLLDRLRSNNGGSGGGIRNESYNRAVHDSMNDSKVSSLDGSTRVEHPPPRPQPPPIQPRRPNKLAAPTVNVTPSEMVMIEQDDPYAPVQKFSHSSKLRPHSTIGIMRTNSYSSSSQSNDDGQDYRDTRPPEFIMDWDRRRTEAKEDYSPVVDPMKAFQREGFGRQSMSEKRKVKAHLDPRGSEYYQRAKQAQGENNRGTSIPNPGPLTRAGSAESLLGRTNTSSVHDYTSHNPTVVGPTLGMKKSSSLESLETAMQDVGMDNNDEVFWSRGAGRYQRNRGCNESFRAAVDRSYDPSKLQIQMDILEEDSSENGSNMAGRPGSSTRSSFSSEPTDQDSLKRKKKEKEKKGGIFKGIFKFGRNRKTVDNLKTSPFEGERQPQSEWEKPHAVAGERIHPPRPPQPTQERLQEHYRRVQENQRQQEWEKRERERELYEYEQQHNGQENYLDNSLNDIQPGTRAERIQQLRHDHQRKHRERQGQYPLDEQEELYEQELQNEERRVPIGKDVWRYGESKAPTNALELPPRQRSDSRQEYESRPSSRLGFSDNINYSHYQNHDEIQEHMRRDDYYRDQYLRQQRQTQSQSHMRQLQPIGPPLSGRVDPYNRQPGDVAARWQSYSASNVRPYTPIPQMYTNHQRPSHGEIVHQRSTSYEDYDDPRYAYQDPQPNYGYPAANRRLNPSSAKV